MPTSVLMLHGLEGGPGGAKSQRLRASGDYALTVPQLPTAPIVEFLAARWAPIPDGLASPSLEVARAALVEAQPQVLMGSSFGGALALWLAAHGEYPGPLVLLAPAGERLFGLRALPVRAGRVVVLHGRADAVVPVEDSVRLAAASSCEVALWLVDDDHRLTRSVAGGLLEEAITWALGGLSSVPG